jgi:excinuclease UvrABC nuclease subunit
MEVEGDVMAKDPAVIVCLSKWFTPNTYDQNYKYPTDNSGVYVIVLPNNEDIDKSKILYIGSAKNLSVRYRRHEVMRMLKEFYGYVQFYFKEEQNYRETEKQLIKMYQPKFNKQWR